MRGVRFLLGLALAAMPIACGSPPRPSSPIERVRADLARGDGFGAELKLQRMLAAGAPRSSLAAYSGEAELLQGDQDQAESWLAPGDFSPATAARGFHLLGRLRLQQGDGDAAAAAFDQAMARDPRDAGLWVDIGRMRYQAGQQVQAIAAARRAIALDPENPQGLLFRGQLVRDAQGPAAALGWFAHAYRVAPTDADTLTEYAATLLEAGEAARALAIARELAAVDGDDSRAYLIQALIAARAGDFDLAQDLIDRTGAMTDSVPSAMMLSGLMQLAAHNYASAAQIFDRLYRQQPENRQAGELLANALALSGSDLELTHRFGDAALAADASPYLMTVVARGWEALGERRMAATLLDRAARARPTGLVVLPPDGDVAPTGAAATLDGVGTVMLVRSLLQHGQVSEARRIADGFLARVPGSSDALGLAGDVRLAAGDPAAAARFYSRAAAIRQPWSLARRRYAALLAQNRREQATALLVQFARGHPQAIEPLTLLARSAVRADDDRRAAMPTARQ